MSLSVRNLLIVVIFACLLASTGGCAVYRVETYTVTVRNQAAEPVTIWLTKTGGKYEDGWKSPEDLAIESPRFDERISGIVVPPGKTAVTESIRGRFTSGSRAVLRVYEGSPTFTELLAFSENTGGRTDVLLDPGDNEVVVRQLASSRIEARRIARPAPSK